ncbi:MAG: hypothetical protein HQM16_05475 [Deltaproteobacteria bacterium]|nr:hypothetical protein [Deltaproteobacteria bacterium]
MKTNILRVLFVQSKIEGNQPLAAKKNILRQIKANLHHKPHLVMLPEVCLGSSVSKIWHDLYLQEYDSLIMELTAMAQAEGVCFYGSAYKARDKGLPYNTAFFIGPDRVKKSYNKIHLFKYHHEHKIYASGDRIEIFKTPLGVIAPLICYDIRFPELMREQCFRGAKMALVCAQWPLARREHWLCLLRARAIENQMFVIACNATGVVNENIKLGGSSCIFSPWGELMYQMSATQKTGVIEINTNAIDETRKAYPFLRDARRKDFHFGL